MYAPKVSVLAMELLIQDVILQVRWTHIITAVYDDDLVPSKATGPR